ncbi:copper resistance CopC/CopD family protein [Streptomyces sp. PAL114]|uniref:copper resistance CopC/CopD family protein n=1 Tax=Streptomyces sp. PAL114 TaxID=2970893 RepID=UPI0028FD469C|nr:copper resistance protein CopC [Streptomyces sp. PAL114]MDU0299899.1 copper resistance protein CopC [Streptomyces sp. PAL114]
MTQTIAPRVRTLVLLLLAVTGALLAGAAPASAHAALTGSDPAQGAVVDTAPAQVSLTFSEPIAVSDDSVRVLDPKGERVDKGAPANPSGTTFSVRLLSGLPDGTYTVAYQVVSADSHPVAGAFTFSIGAPSETTVSVAAQGSDDGLVGWLYGFGRYVSYAGFVVMVGGAAFVLACWGPGARVRPVQRLVVSGWLTLTAATLGLLLMRGSYTTSGKVGDIFDLSLLGDVLQTKSGAALVSRLLLLAAAALFIAVLFGAYARTAAAGGPDDGPASATASDDGSDPATASDDDSAQAAGKGHGADEGSDGRDLTFGLAIGGTVVAAGLAASWAMSEHASQGLQPGVAMPVDVVHLLAVAVWLGGLTALLVALYRAPAASPVGRDAVRRFSRLAFGSVVTLAVTGVYQSWRQLGSWSAFTDTRYGQLLLVKITLVAVMVAVAFLSRRWTQRLADVRIAGEAEQEKQPAGAVPVQASEASDAEKTGSGKGQDAVRAAQLARQRAATEAARQKRLRDADPNRFGLRRSVLAEAGVAVVLLAVTTVLTQTEPGRTEQDARTAADTSASASAGTGQGSGAVSLTMPFDTGGANGKGVVSVDLDPARVGDNDMHVYVEGPGGRAVDVPEVKIALTLTAQDIGPLPVAPDHITTGHWSASGVQIPMAGDWKVEVTVRTSDIDQVTVSKNAQIG